jgi:hypothetical protein
MEVPTRKPTHHPAPPLPDPDDPHFKSVELAQRARLTVDIATADLEVAESRLGPFHETTWHFRTALAEARHAWEHLRAAYGRQALEAALAEPPVVVMRLGPAASGSDQPAVLLIPIAGHTYRVEPLAGIDLAPRRVRLTPLHPGSAEPDLAPYYVCRLADHSTQCDCAAWVYRIAETSPPPSPCKHLAALIHLGWL